MDASIEEIEFLARSDHRAGVLDTLARHPCDRADLQRATGASSPTVGRILGNFEDRRWITRDGATYELTPLGGFVAERFADLRSAMRTERKLRDVWRWLPREMEGFSVDLFADAVVSYPGPGYPYQPVERISQLIEETTAMRGFGTTVFKSINNETVCRGVLSGMDFEYIYSPEVLEATIAWNPERVAQAAACENCTIFLHDDLPDENRCGIGIFDDRIGLCCHDAETGMLEAVVDTDAVEAREWAVSVFERHLADARPIDADEKAELFPSTPVT
ncbi:helix-turn-helix transcriptional regulator [Haloarchaeobius sp. HRN-SO-5]|uniref:helix-turn-helix transcriptional regulator n=1 Tax=Haloarchaeobius sp. HRN-SO-5 TaxID=3446118 RepID=UPI003EB9A7BD